MQVGMSISIRLRTVLALNVFVVGLALTLGWIAQDVAGELVQERFVQKMVTSASSFLKGSSLPPNDSVMGYFGELFDAEWVVSGGNSGDIIGSSLPATLAEEFRDRAMGAELAGTARLDSGVYRFHSADVQVMDPRTRRRIRGRLYMLVPRVQLQSARRRARARVGRVVWPAAIAATVLAVLLSVSITHPIRKLARQMDRLSDAQPTPEAEHSVSGGPTEVSRLAASFYRLMDRLRDAQRQVIQSDRLATLGRMALSVAHELRNPLSGIRMNVRVLKDRQGMEQDPGIEAILREIDRMDLYVEELMSLAPGTSASSRSASMERTHLSELAGGVLTILSGRLRHAGLEVRTDYPPDEPAVTADANQIRQVVMNLLVNAIEATPAGGAISVGIRRTGSGVRFSVTDSGGGVQYTDEDVFAAFVSSKQNGSGLGLYICRHMVTDHGGTIGYENGDAGATFWFELPDEPVARDGETTSP